MMTVKSSTRGRREKTARRSSRGRGRDILASHEAVGEKPRRGRGPNGEGGPCYCAKKEVKLVTIAIFSPLGKGERSGRRPKKKKHFSYLQ